jgi:GNAT superfamily N-acetyltransferase
METRFATTADSAALAPLMAELGYPTLPEQMARRMEITALRDDYAAFVAAEDGIIAGMIGLSISPSFYRDDPGGAIVALVVSSEFRGRGVAALLVERAEGWFSENGIHRVTVNPSNHRTPAHSLYRRLGYESTGTRFTKTLSA